MIHPFSRLMVFHLLSTLLQNRQQPKKIIACIDNNVLREMRDSGEKKLIVILGASGAAKSSLAPHLSIPPPLQRLEHLIAG